MIYILLPLTITVFLIVRYIALKIKSPFFNSFVISLLILIPLLLIMNVSYAEYSGNVSILTTLLPYSVVALAFPLYELLPEIRSRWRSILFISFVASVTAMISGFFIAFWLGASPELAASILPKSVTTPIAITIAHDQGGIQSIAALCVVIVGTFGALMGFQLLDLFKIKSKVGRGLAIGAISHAIGTARALEVDLQEGAYSSLALVLCGIMTSFIAPFLFPILVYFYSLS